MHELNKTQKRINNKPLQPKSNLEILGDKMRNLIETAGQKQNEVAFALDMSVSRLSNYLQGHREPDIETLSRFAFYFGVPLDHFNLSKKDNNSENAKHAINKYAEFIMSLDESINVEIVTEMGRKRFLIHSNIVSRLIKEHLSTE